MTETINCPFCGRENFFPTEFGIAMACMECMALYEPALPDQAGSVILGLCRYNEGREISQEEAHANFEYLVQEEVKSPYMGKVTLMWVKKKLV